MADITKKENSIPRVMIAAPSSGSGKTVITMGLLEALKRRDLAPASFKCGPDYIDPMFHKRVLDVDCVNLDTFFSDASELKRTLNRYAGAVSVLEGVMGIYDGTGPDSVKGSCYETAEATGTPVILVMNASGIGRTVIPLIKGILGDDRSCLIKGIILNRMSGKFYDKLLPHLEKEINELRPDVTILGHIPNDKRLNLDSRHLGLVMPKEMKDIGERIGNAADLLEEYVSIEKILKIASSAGDINEPDRIDLRAVPVKERVRLAVAEDEAFCFYYRENIRLLQDMGADIVRFSPLHDSSIPDGVSGLLIGGGYPELHLEELSANTSMLGSVRGAIAGGMPSLAECGGFMYLHDTIAGPSGKEYGMVGLIKGKCFYTGHLVNFGYVEVCGTKDDNVRYLTGLRGHEFHYYDSTGGGIDVVLCRPSDKTKYEAMIAKPGRLWGFAHFYYPSDPEALYMFIKEMERYGN